MNGIYFYMPGIQELYLLNYYIPVIFLIYIWHIQVTIKSWLHRHIPGVLLIIVALLARCSWAVSMDQDSSGEIEEW